MPDTYELGLELDKVIKKVLFLKCLCYMHERGLTERVSSTFEGHRNVLLEIAE